MPAFRDLLWPTVIAVPALALLLALGTWQLDRRQWKHDLIARVSERAASAPVALPAAGRWPSLDLGDWEYRPVTTAGRFDHTAESYVFTTLSEPRGPLGGPGYWVLTPLRLETGGVVLVNRGFVPEARRDPATRPQGQVEGMQQIEGLVRLAEVPGLFTPDPDPATRTWYARDIGSITRSLGLDDAAPFVIDAAESPPGGLPQAGETRLSFRDDHLSYALTWYGLAVALVVVYLAYCRARGRTGPPLRG